MATNFNVYRIETAFDSLEIVEGPNGEIEIVDTQDEGTSVIISLEALKELYERSFGLKAPTK